MRFTAVSSCLEIKFFLGKKKGPMLGRGKLNRVGQKVYYPLANTALLRLGLAGALQRYGLVRVMLQLNVGGFSFGLVCFFQS